MNSIVVRYEPGSSGRFCASIIQSMIADHKDQVDPYGGMHRQDSLPDVAQTHKWIEDVIDQYDTMIQIILDKKDVPLVCRHFYSACIKRWWDTGLLQQYHPDLNKQELLKILMQKAMPDETLQSMIDHHKKYQYAFTKYPDNKIHTITLDCLLNKDPVQELLKIFPTDKDLSELNNMVAEYQQTHKKIYS